MGANGVGDLTKPAKVTDETPAVVQIHGGSAGGHLALSTARKFPVKKVAGAVSTSGIADPEVDYPSHPDMYAGLFGVKDPKVVTREMRDPTKCKRVNALGGEVN